MTNNVLEIFVGFIDLDPHKKWSPYGHKENNHQSWARVNVNASVNDVDGGLERTDGRKVRTGGLGPTEGENTCSS